MQPKWMGPHDKDILEFLSNYDIPLTAQIMAYRLEKELGIKHGLIKQRLRVLQEHGMVSKPDEHPEGLTGRGTYVISDFGKRFLEGEITIKEMRDLDPTFDN